MEELRKMGERRVRVHIRALNANAQWLICHLLGIRALGIYMAKGRNIEA